MSTVHVFDIASKVWFAQSTTGISELSSDSLCFVVASAEDNSSHNIYVLYGGVGTNMFDIWVLTLPAFQWVRVYLTGDTSNSGGTTGYTCHKVHEKHMVAYRGLNFNDTCDSDEGVGKHQGMAILDMSSLEWTTKVEVENQRYLVPERLYKIIGGK